MLLYISNNILLSLILTFDFLLLFTLCLIFLVISKIHVLFGLKMNEDDICLADCETLDKKYFLKLTLIKTNVSTISGTTNLVEGFGRANITLPNGTRFHINDALYSSKSKRNLLNFKDICINGYHIETMNEDNVEYLYITSIISNQKLIMEKLPAFSSGLYYTTIKPIESYVVVNQKFKDPKVFVLWHDRLGHLGSSMMRQIIEHSHGHPLKNQKILLPHEYSCTACSQDKLIVIPSFTKVIYESLVFLERIHGDICGPIHPPCGPFHYFMILINASIRWSHVCLLSKIHYLNILNKLKKLVI